MVTNIAFMLYILDEIVKYNGYNTITHGSIPTRIPVLTFARTWRMENVIDVIQSPCG